MSSPKILQPNLPTPQSKHLSMRAANAESQAPSLQDLSPEERAEAEAMVAEMAEARERLAGTPASVVVANHLMGLYELAAIHLSSDPPKPDEAKIAIDAMGAVLSQLPGRLGEHEDTLKAAVSQIQLAFVEATSN